MKKDTKILIGVGAALAGGYYLLRRPAAASSTYTPPSTAPPPKEGGFLPPEPKPTQGTFGGPTGPGHHGPGPSIPPPPKPVPVDTHNELCNTPLQVQPANVAQLLADLAIPAYRQAIGDELAPSASQEAAALDAASKSITDICNVPSTAAMIAKGARVLVMGSRYGTKLQENTSIGRLCLGKKLDTAQSLSLLIDVGVDTLRHGGGEEQIHERLLQGCGPGGGGTVALGLSDEVAGGAVLIHDAVM